VLDKTASADGLNFYNATYSTNLTAWHGGDNLILSVAAQNNNTIVVVHSVGQLIVEPWIDHPNVTAVRADVILAFVVPDHSHTGFVGRRSWPGSWKLHHGCFIRRLESIRKVAIHDR
jgi:hypothetical protein